VALAVLSACCTLLQGYGQELRPHLAKLQVVGQKYTRRSWVAAGRYPRLKVRVTAACGIGAQSP
jgi:hypothetical protein